MSVLVVRSCVSAAEQQGISKTKLARSVGIDHTVISHVLAGRRALTLKAMLALCRAVGNDLRLVISTAKQ